MNNYLFTQTLLKSFDILNCFESDGQEIGIKEIADRINMPQSSVYRIVQSLEFVGLIFQNKENRKYRLGPKLISLSNKRRRLDEYQSIVIKYMEALEEETGETINLGILDCDKITYIYRVECRHVLRPSFELNAAYPAHRTGLGLVLLADLSDMGLQWVYQNNAEDIGMPFDAFLEVIRDVRKNGYAYDDQVFCSGLRCVAAPVKGPGGKAIFSISVSAPIMRMDDETYRRTQRLVVKYAASASQDIMSLG